MSQEIKFKGQALNSIVIVREIENKQVSSSGLDLTSQEDKNQKYKKGIVQSLGNNVPKISIKILGFEIPFVKKALLKTGDTIMYDSYKASPITVDSIVYDCIYFSDVTIIL